MLYDVAVKYGISIDSSRPVGKPKLTHNERKFVNGLKRKYRQDIRNASDMRVDIMNMTLGLGRSQILSVLNEHKETAALLAMMFNNEQLAILFALRDEQQNINTTKENK